VKSTLPLLCQVSHYLGETAIRIDSNSAKGVFLTLTRQTPLKTAVDNLWYNSGWVAIVMHEVCRWRLGNSSLSSFKKKENFVFLHFYINIFSLFCHPIYTLLYMPRRCCWHHRGGLTGRGEVNFLAVRAAFTFKCGAGWGRERRELTLQNLLKPSMSEWKREPPIFARLHCKTTRFGGHTYRFHRIGGRYNAKTRELV
jgi:hypothetical protein